MYTPVRSLQSASQGLLVLPMSSLKTIGDRAFSVAGPSDWISLLDEIQACQTSGALKGKLKTHLFRAALFLVWYIAIILHINVGSLATGLVKLDHMSHFTEIMSRHCIVKLSPLFLLSMSLFGITILGSIYYPCMLIQHL